MSTDHARVHRPHLLVTSATCGVGETHVGLEALVVPDTGEAPTTFCDAMGGQIRLEPTPFVYQAIAADPVPPCNGGQNHLAHCSTTSCC